jgi:hypothetical protein
VSTGCSVRQSAAPLPFSSWTDVLQVFERAGEPVDPVHHEGVARAQEVEQEARLRPASRPAPPRFSARTTWQPTARNPSSWGERSWSSEGTLA